MPDNARAIENLIYTYAERIDAGDVAGVADTQAMFVDLDGDLSHHLLFGL